MSSVQTIEVHTAPAYEVTIGAGLLRDCGARLKTVLGGCRIAVVADSNVAPLYLETVCASLRDAGFAVCSYVFPAGESHKNFTTLSAILALKSKDAERLRALLRDGREKKATAGGN